MKLDLVHQTISPRKRVGSGDEANSDLSGMKGFIQLQANMQMQQEWVIPLITMRCVKRNT